MMDSIPAVFQFGQCPCCDKIIPVPSGTAKTHCCYCGAQFLSAAAIKLYGVKERIEITSNYKADLKPKSEDIVQDKPKTKSDTYTGPKMMSVRQLCQATGVSQKAIRELIKQGKIPTFYSGKKALINYTKFCEMLDSVE